MKNKQKYSENRRFAVISITATTNRGCKGIRNWTWIGPLMSDEYIHSNFNQGSVKYGPWAQPKPKPEKCLILISLLHSYSVTTTLLLFVGFIQLRLWTIEENDGPIKYSRPQARYSHLIPGKLWQSSIVDFFGSIYSTTLDERYFSPISQITSTNSKTFQIVIWFVPMWFFVMWCVMPYAGSTFAWKSPILLFIGLKEFLTILIFHEMALEIVSKYFCWLFLSPCGNVIHKVLTNGVTSIERGEIDQINCLLHVGTFRWRNLIRLEIIR